MALNAAPLTWLTSCRAASIAHMTKLLDLD
jgi:hypothetical protein